MMRKILALTVGIFCYKNTFPAHGVEFFMEYLRSFEDSLKSPELVKTKENAQDILALAPDIPRR